ncbi:MAG: hypothetical protein J1E61_07385 [Lachnospiraceae bacterium]|nr:hypothetical protein [Lachnospiraceae bacterium]
MQTARTRPTVRRWIARLLCAVMIGSMVSPALPVLAAGEEKGLIAQFTFDDGDRLADSSGKGVEATLYKIESGSSNPVASDDLSTYFDGSGGEQNALHLTGDSYLALPAGTLNGLTEMTVEMRIRLENPTPNNWLFYAAPYDNAAENERRYIGMSINYNSADNTTTINVPRYYEAGNDPIIQNTATNFHSGDWYTVKAVFKVSSMALYVNGIRVNEIPVANTVAGCLGENNAIWIGHSGWSNNTNFSGYIDDIKIYNYAKVDDVDVGAINEKDYIIADAVDPDYTTVNMFDYWITDQKDADSFSSDRTADWFMNTGINAGHLFLFAGSNGVSGLGTNETVGGWNNFGGDGHATYEPYDGIVKRVLKEGYPQLAIDELVDGDVTTIPGTLSDRSEEKRTESLAYLFDPDFTDPNPSRAVYTDVTGLFRLDGNGYYYFNSGDTYAELNRYQDTRPKTSKEGENQITLYRQAWDNNYDPKTQTTTEVLGQFFPFNDWSDLFYVGDDGKLIQANGQGGQSTTDEPLNHYFGMTVETKFQQPENGRIIDESDPDKEPQKMEFYFSGDDDIWIFIDDVLVADLGGLHMRVSVTIDFATGEINYTGDLSGTTTGGKPQPLENFDTNLYEMFQKAIEQNPEIENTVEWQEVDGNQLFADGSIHTLKFFYLERGNAASNCAISFNLHKIENELPDVDPLPEEEPEDKPTEQPPKADKPETAPTEEKPADDPAKQPTADKVTVSGNGAAPKTGDSARPDLWLALSAVGGAGVIGVTTAYYIRKRRKKQQ